LSVQDGCTVAEEKAPAAGVTMLAPRTETTPPTGIPAATASFWACARASESISTAPQFKAERAFGEVWVLRSE
jgi:hypothetical protein